MDLIIVITIRHKTLKHSGGNGTMRTAIVNHEGVSVWALGATAAVVLAVLVAGSVLVTGSPSAWLEFVLRIVLTSEAAPAV